MGRAAIHVNGLDDMVASVVGCVAIVLVVVVIVVVVVVVPALVAILIVIGRSDHRGVVVVVLGREVKSTEEDADEEGESEDQAHRLSPVRSNVSHGPRHGAGFCTKRDRQSRNVLGPESSSGVEVRRECSCSSCW